MSRRIVIIGGGAAGVSAATAARKGDFNAQITIVSREPELAYSRCGMPFSLSGEVKRPESLILHDEKFYSMMRIAFLVNTEALEIDTNAHKVKTKNKDGGAADLNYDSLIIATGASPFSPKIPGIETIETHYFRTLKDLKGIMKSAKKNAHAVVIGARYTGLEVAEALATKGTKVTVVDMLPQILPGLFDKVLAEQVQAHLEKKSIQFVLGHEIEAIKNGHCFVGSKNLEADFIVLAAGVRGNTELAKKAGIALGPTGLIHTNPKLTTSAPDVYAAGDCIESLHLLTGEPMPMQFGSLAAAQGAVAGTNATGGDASFPSQLCAHSSKLFGLELAATGLTEETARFFGFKPVTQTVDSAVRPHFYDDKRVKLKLVADEEGRLLGAQAIGTGEAGWRINYLSQAIARGTGVGELAQAEFAYCPATADAIEPIRLAADALHRKILLTRIR